MTRRHRFLAATARAARWLITPPPVPPGSQLHPDGGPGPYLPPGPTVPPAPRIAPLGSPRGEFRPCPDEIEATNDPADGFDPVAEAERIIRRAMP